MKWRHNGGYANGRLVVGGAKALVEETIFETVVRTRTISNLHSGVEEGDKPERSDL